MFITPQWVVVPFELYAESSLRLVFRRLLVSIINGQRYTVRQISEPRRVVLDRMGSKYADSLRHRSRTVSGQNTTATSESFSIQRNQVVFTMLQKPAANRMNVGAVCQ